MKQYITTERANLFEPNVAITMVFSIYGNTSEENIRKAFITAIKANEILHSKIVMDYEGKAWYEKVSKIVNSINSSNDNWRNILKEQQKICFAIEKGELLRIFLFQQENGWRVLLLAHHLAGDGKSLIYFIEDAMNALNEQALIYKEIKLLTPETLPPKSTMPLLAKMYVKYINRKWKLSRRIFSISDYQKMHRRYWENRQSEFFVERFSVDELERLKHDAKNAQVSLISYLMTAFFQLLSGKISAGIAVNGRLDRNRCMGNQTTGISVDYYYKKRRSFSYNAKSIQRKMSIKLHSARKKYFILHFMNALDCNLVDSITMYEFGEFQNHVSKSLAKTMGYTKVTKDLSITNLTKLDIPIEYGKYKIRDFLFIPPIISYGKRLIGIATLGDEMIITYHILQDERIEKEKKYFFQVMKILKDNHCPERN